MNLTACVQRPDRLPPATPTIECDVPGPRGERGCLLRAVHSESLVWDLESEIGSARRQWQEDRAAWWVAASYLDTLVDIVLRAYPSVLVLGTAGPDRLLSRDGRSAVQERLL